jgi:hypothetical protein
MRRRDMQDPNLSQSHLLANKMNINLYVLCATMMDGIRSHIYSTNVVAINNGSLGEGNMKLLKQLSEPTTLSNNVRHCPVLSLSTGTRNCSLAFRGPRHQIISKIYTVA